MTLVEKIASGIDYYLHRVAELTEERRLELGNPEWMDYTEQDKIAKNEAAKGILQAILSDSIVEIEVGAELPKNPHTNRRDVSDYGLGLMNGYDQALKDMANWVKEKDGGGK
ncbi:hypothetical protein LCGC14_1191870 [marine sediment metagenome]|uniref:Uncharacterized protein n=1 Tax=marine sediment metagenome TaxID=412755 RepID=A0A0F9M6Z2_9ZZZZ